MHELSLAENVMQMIESAAIREPFSRVKLVYLEIGELACVQADAMRFCFDAVTRGTIAEGAQLEIVEVEGRGWCGNCQTEVTMHDALACCPVCAEVIGKITGGRELRLKHLEVE